LGKFSIEIFEYLPYSPGFQDSAHNPGVIGLNPLTATAIQTTISGCF